jgi:hypothetical protein
VNGGRVLEYDKISMVLREIETKLAGCRRAVGKHACAIFGISPRTSHHLSTVRGNPGIIRMLGELGNKALRHVDLSPEHDFQCGCALLQRCERFSCRVGHGVDLHFAH